MLICDFDDQPGISVQGGRQNVIADLSLAGSGISYFYNKQIGGYNHDSMTNFGIDDRDVTSYFDPARPQRSPLLRFNPAAGIAVDPLLNNQPAAASPWAQSSAVTYGSYRTANSKLYICKFPGTTLGSGTGPSATTDDITDGTVTWSYVGPSSLAVAYPSTMVAPAFIPLVNRIAYGKLAPSSNTRIENAGLYGFAVGVAVQPCNGDANGDFTALRDCETSSCAFGLSIGNTQSRNVELIRCTGAFLHTLITTNKHGHQNGKMGGIALNSSYSALYQVFDWGSSSIVGPFTFKEFYTESMQRIGTAAGGGASGTQIAFENCQFVFNHNDANGQRGVPLTPIGVHSSIVGVDGPGATLRLQGMRV